MARPEVILLKSSSRPFFLPTNVSAPPAIAPDIPALLPDCSKTVAINPNETKTWIISRNVFTKFHLPDLQLNKPILA